MRESSSSSSSSSSTPSSSSPPIANKPIWLLYLTAASFVVAEFYYFKVFSKDYSQRYDDNAIIFGHAVARVTPMMSTDSKRSNSSYHFETAIPNTPFKLVSSSQSSSLFTNPLNPFDTNLTLRKIVRPKHSLQSISSSSSSLSLSTQQDINNNNKPFFILHIGPPKTATTALQSKLTEFKEILQQDNYTYVGQYVDGSDQKKNKILNGFSRRCAFYIKKSDMDSGNPPPDCWKQSTFLLLQNFKGHNIILSEENLSAHGMHWKVIHDSLTPFWHVQIIITYRRFSDWILSAKNQIERPTPAQRRRRIWKSMGGIPTLPHYPYIGNIVLGKQGMPLWYANDAIELTQPYFSNNNNDIGIWNLHAYDNPVVGFLCDALPHANITCQAAMAQEQQQQQQELATALQSQKDESNQNASSSQQQQQNVVNPSIPLEYDMFVFEAANQGLINLNISRPEVAQLARHYHETVLNQTIHDFPWTCPTAQELWPLFQYTAQYEYILVPEFYNSSPLGGPIIIEGLFQKHLQTKKYCSINVNLILQDKNWQNFFVSTF